MRDKFLSNMLKIFLILTLLIIYIVIIIKINNTNIWIYKSFVIFMFLVLIIYFMFRLIRKYIPIKMELVAKVVRVDDNDKIVNITYQYLDKLFCYEVDFYEYDQNKYFKYRLDSWYTIIVCNDKVIKLLDPASEPVINKEQPQNNYYKSLKYGIHIYIYFIFEFLFLINLILFPLEVVLTDYKINSFVFILIEVVNIILFAINSKILKKD